MFDLSESSLDSGQWSHKLTTRHRTSFETCFLPACFRSSPTLHDRPGGAFPPLSRSAPSARQSTSVRDTIVCRQPSQGLASTLRSSSPGGKRGNGTSRKAPTRTPIASNPSPPPVSLDPYSGTRWNDLGQLRSSSGHIGRPLSSILQQTRCSSHGDPSCTPPDHSPLLTFAAIPASRKRAHHPTGGGTWVRGAAEPLR